MTSCHLSSSLPVRKRPKGEVDDVDDVEEAFNIFAADANVGSSENGGRIISLLCRPTSPDNDLRAGHGNILEGFSATAPLNPESPLATVMSHSSKNEPTSSSSSPARARETIFSSKTYGGLNKQGKIEASQPVTFRSKIKSSGYGVGSAGSAKPSNFKRQAPKKPPSITTSSLSSASATKFGALHQLLLRQAGANADSSMPPSRISASIRPTDAGASHSVSRLRVLPACRPGGLVLCGAANGASYLLEGANPGGSGLVERRNGPQLAAGGVGGGGIGGSPVACDCSLNGDRLLTANADGTCRMWNLATGRHLFEVTEQLKAAASKKTGHSSASQQLRNRQSELTHAQFYFLDKFIILALGNRIRLCVYRLTSGSEKRDDVKTYNATGGRCKLAHCIEVPECQQVTACSALNSAHSYRILAACSDRVVRLFDLNSRQPNCLATYAEADDSSTTSYAALAGAGWTFLTVAKGGPVKLWDLRVGTGPVSATHLRVSGSVRSGLSLRAGCGDASDGFACGAEDRRTLFYDARNLSRPVGEVTGFTDCVTAIDCRSDTGVCVVGTNDGSVCLLD